MQLQNANESGAGGATNTNIDQQIAIAGPNGSAVAVYLARPGDTAPMVSGSHVYITNTTTQGTSALDNGSAATMDVARISSAHPTGYVTTQGWGASFNERALLRVNHAGPRPADTACFLHDKRQYIRNRLASAQPQGTISLTVAGYGGLPTIASATVNHFAGADPLPYATRNTVNQATGYTLLEDWLHRRNAEVLP